MPKSLDERALLGAAIAAAMELAKHELLDKCVVLIQVVTAKGEYLGGSSCGVS